MKTSSAKAKGRRLQQQIAQDIREILGLSDNDVRSNPMGAQGVDVWLSDNALESIPFSIECKNTERLNLWAAIEQAETNRQKGTAPVVITSKNRKEPYAILPWATLIDILSEFRRLGMSIRKVEDDVSELTE